MELFAALGFGWDRSAVLAEEPTYSMERVCFRFHRMLPEFVWDAGVLEGNPFTFPEVKTLLDGVTVGGHRVAQMHLGTLYEKGIRVAAYLVGGFLLVRGQQVLDVFSYDGAWGIQAARAGAVRPAVGRAITR
jgi:hypothetical protein